jgi:HSP20 family molecular chaperone IbpA
MSFLFPRSNFQEFSPLFRLADELDRVARSGHGQHSNSNWRSFNPRFDVKETADAYELHGELPGIERKNINIEWSDENTLTISGHTEHRSELTSDGEAIEVTDENKHEYHKPTVEDESAKDTKPEDQTTVTKTSADRTVAKADDRVPRYWITERSVGSFHRTFQFPSVDHDGVTANLKDGILSVIVPKAKAKEPRKVTIS